MSIKKLTTSLLLLGSLALTGQAHAFSTGFGEILVLDGLVIDGAQPTTFVFEKTNPDELAVAIKWDFIYEAGGSDGASWGSELGITIVAPDGTSWDLGTSGANGSCAPCDADFGFASAPGVYQSAGAIDLGGLHYGLGFWEITIFESFDDPGFDGEFLQGVIGINKVIVPIPAALWLLASGLLGLGALRRRGA